MLNPTDGINVSFNDYVAERTMKEAKHLVKGIPDYAFASDYSLRQKIKNMPGVVPFFKAVMDYNVPLSKQIMSGSQLRVTSRQYPKIFEMIDHCAKTLGIGMPAVFINPDPSQINAAAYCTDDDDPLITITTGAIERLDDEELVAILGHECGHIHNNHAVYNAAVTYLSNMAASAATRGLGYKIQAATFASLQIALNAWSRAAEVTADRAAVICCGSEEPELRLRAKGLSGGIFNESEYDIDEILRQYDDLNTAERYYELMRSESTHPVSIRRMLAVKEFVKSDVYFSWHPEQKVPGSRLYTKEELDARCDKYVSVLKNEKRR